MLETGRTFATLFADMDLRLRLLLVRSEEEFKRLLWQHTKELAEEQTQMVRRLSTASGLGIGIEALTAEVYRDFSLVLL